jgi:hypothetical protein
LRICGVLGRGYRIGRVVEMGRRRRIQQDNPV